MSGSLAGLVAVELAIWTPIGVMALVGSIRHGSFRAWWHS